MANVRFTLFREGNFILVLQWVLVSYLRMVIFIADANVALWQQVIISILAVVSFTGIGIYMKNGTFGYQSNREHRKDPLWGVVMNLAVFCFFIFSLLNDLFSWQKILTTIKVFINIKSIITEYGFRVFVQFLTGGRFAVMLNVASIISLVFVNIDWIIGLFTIGKTDNVQ
jgi:hypothetical protein